METEELEEMMNNCDYAWVLTPTNFLCQLKFFLIRVLKADWDSGKLSESLGFSDIFTKLNPNILTVRFSAGF